MYSRVLRLVWSGIVCFGLIACSAKGSRSNRNQDCLLGKATHNSGRQA